MNSSATVTFDERLVKWSKAIRRIVFFQSNAGTVSDIIKGGLFVLVISQGGVATYNFNNQICFKDL